MWKLRLWPRYSQKKEYISGIFVAVYLTGAVGLEGAQHRGGFKEKLPNAEGGEVLIPLVQSHLYGVLQALCESEWA